MENEIIKEKVIEAIAKAERSVARYEKMLEPVTSKDAIGRVSRMNAINNKTIAYSQLETAKTKLANLQKVLDSVGTETFGLCVNCKKKIAIGRILVRPESVRCVKCAQ